MTEALTLVTNRICPFAQRAWLTLLEKEVPFTFKEANLVQKEAWFTETYRRAYAHDPASDGKVPVLVHNDQVLTQSDLIAWYVAESFDTGTQLIPQKPFDRLCMRRIIQEAPGKVISAFYSTRNYHKKPEAEQQAVRAKIEENLKAVEALIEGPYVLGETFSLADILLYPWYERWFINESFFGIAIPAELTKTHAFIAAMQSRPSVQRTLAEANKEFFLQGYLSYLKPQ